jgi:hypothetical protein
MRYIILALIALGPWCPQVSSAEQVTKVWSASSAETQDPATFPYRVIQRSPWDVQLVEGGRPSKVLSVVSTNRSTTPTVTTGIQPQGFGEEFHFTLTGNMALFVPNSEASPSYIRAFDPSTGSFLAGDPFVFESRPEFAVGESRIAAFEETGRRHVLYAPERIDLYVVSHDGARFSSQKPWGDDRFTSVKALDINAAGDVAAIVAQCGPPTARACRCKLVVVQGQKATEHPIGDGLDCPIAVGISPDSRLVAVGINNHVIVYHLDATPVQIADVSVDACLPLSTCSIRKLAVSNEGRIAAWAMGFPSGAPPASWHVIAVSDSQCQGIASYEFGAVRNPRVRFLQGGRLYIDAQRLREDEEPVASVLEFE